MGKMVRMVSQAGMDLMEHPDRMVLMVLRV